MKKREDIVERLRLAPEHLSNLGPKAELLICEAAEEIARLRALEASNLFYVDIGRLFEKLMKRTLYNFDSNKGVWPNPLSRDGRGTIR